MKLITAPIAHNQTGSVVVNLIECILFLIGKNLVTNLLQIYDAPNQPYQDEINTLVAGVKLELAAQVYGANAQRLVLYSQMQNGLGDHLQGVVDDKTAALLNRMLEKYGAFTTEKIFVVTGVVTDSITGARQNNMQIKAFDRDGVKRAPLGETTTNSSGEYRITFSEPAYKNTLAEREGVELVVKAFDEFTSEVGKATVTTSEQNIILNISTTSEVWTVEGRVTKGEVPINNVLIEVLDRDLRKRQSLCKTTSDSNGYYRTAFRTKDFQRADKKVRATPWLIVEAKETKDSTAIVIEKQQGVARHNTINVYFAQQLPSEWDLISEAVTPLLDGQANEGEKVLPISEINPSDYDFLEHETGFGKDLLNAWISAYTIHDYATQQLSDLYALEKTTLQNYGWQFFYAFTRSDSRVDFNSIIKRSLLELKDAWKKAQALNRVPELDKETIAILCDAIVITGKLQLLQSTSDNNSSFVRLVEAMSVELPQNIALDALAIYQEQGFNDPDAFLTLKNTHQELETDINRLVRHIRVHQLVDGHNEFAKKLHTKFTDDSDSIAPLASISSSGWLSMAKEASLSGGLALQVQASVEKQHTLIALQARIDDGEFQLESIGEIKEALKQDVKKVEAILQGRIFIKNKDNAPVSFKILQGLGQYVRTGINIEMAANLQQAGIISPAAAMQYGQDGLSEKMAGGYDNNNEYEKEAIFSVTSDFFQKTEPLISSLNAFLIEGGNRSRHYGSGIKNPLPDDVIESLPDMPSIFGDMDECMCRPCESMLGLPAYLVDLLNLLKKQTVRNGGHALNLLNEKRGDIAAIDLSCEMSETVRLHIDIVLGILETAVLLLSPTRENPYLQAGRAIYPWGLPFHRTHVETKTFLQKLGVTRLDLLSSHGGDEPLEYIAAETLNLSINQQDFPNEISDWQLLTEVRRGVAVWEAYGLHSGVVTIFDPVTAKTVTGSVENLLPQVSILLDRTGLTLDELDRIIAAKVLVNTANSEELYIEKRDSCKTSEMRVNFNFDVDLFFSRLHRLVRLKNKIQEWTIEELAMAIKYCGGLLSDEAKHYGYLLRRLATGKRLCDNYKLPNAQLLAFTDSTDAFPNLLGLSQRQFLLLKNIVGLDVPTPPDFAWEILEQFCIAIKRILGAGLTIEQVAEAKLTPAELTHIYGALPPSIKTNEQIEKILVDLQQCLRGVNDFKEDLNLESKVIEALTAIFDATQASKIIVAINSAGAPNAVNRLPAAAMLTTLTTPAKKKYSLGNWLPLLSVDNAKKILAVDASNRINANERFKLLLEAIAEKRRERELIEVMTEAIGLPEVEVVKLLAGRLLLDDDIDILTSEIASEVFLKEDFRMASNVSVTAVPRLHAWVDRVSRLVGLIKLVGIDSELMEISDLVLAHPDSTKNFCRDTLLSDTLASNKALQDWTLNWCALLDLILLQKPEQLSRATLNKLLANLKDLDVQLVSAEALQPLATRFEITKEEVLAITKQAVPELGVTPNAKSLRNPTHLRRIVELLLLARKLNATSLELAKLIDLENNDIASVKAWELLQAKIGEQEWEAVIDKTSNPIRQQRRDALVAHLVQIENLRDANELYEKYLIDPKIGPCFETTELLEAVTATQLFIQRILFGLEPQIMASEELKKHWIWMRNYRVWEANRKVFLFPENWLFPELRDDKSSSFKQLESALGQGELNKELAEEAFGQFLDDVAQMGQMEVLGMYEDEDETIAKRDLYVVGRTPNPPYAYYWRKCIDFGSDFMEWSPWLRIELDIQGDHVMPFILGGQFHIAWPIIRVNKQDKDHVEWEVKLSWTRYDGKSWKKVSISREPINIPEIAFMDERWSFSFRCKTLTDDTAAEIELYILDEIPDTKKDKPASDDDDKEKKPFDLSLNKAIISSLITEDCKNNVINRSLLTFDGNRLQLFISENYHNLPAAIKKHFEVYAMAYESWCVPPGDRVMHPNGNNGLYRQIRDNETVFGIPHGLFEHPENALGIHDTALKNDTNLKGALFERSANEMLSGYLDQILNQTTGTFTATHFKNSLKEVCSFLELKCEVWVRVTVPGLTNPDLKKVNGDKGTFTCSVDGKNLSPSTPVTIIKLGKQDPINYQMTLGIAHSTLPISAAETTIEVPVNRKIVQMIKFEIDGKHLNPAQLIELGIDLTESRNLLLNSKFVLKRDNNVSVIELSKNNVQLLNPLLYSKPWMNGYRENILPSGISPTYPIKIFNNEVMPSSLGGQFLAVQASSSIGVSSSIWHYSENQYGGYINLGFVKTAEDKGLGLYPDSYSESVNAYRFNWNSNYLLLQPDINTGSFSTRNTPTLSAKFNTKDWKEVQSGSLAFNSRLPYACYNWEVFLHAPLMIANQLSKQHKFEEAERWLRYVFDPTDHNATMSNPKPFFKFRVFKKLDLNEQVINDLTVLAKAFNTGSITTAEVKDIQNLINRWRDQPFRPFVIARRRPIAFLWSTLFAYLDNLLSWADSLFRRDTRESINEAVMLYVLVGQILGRRPQQHDGKSMRRPFRYNDLVNKWDDFANAWISLGSGTGEISKESKDKKSDLSGMLYFCKPFNDKILSYWNTADARLINIRNCRNIDGTFRTLPFLDAPIDPELLIRATAAGLDLSDVISGLYAPPPHYRYNILAARAAELTNEVKSLGAAMLLAIEKRDAEHVSQLRSSNEISLLKLVSDVKQLQITEAERNIEALRASRKSTENRYNQYQRLIGAKDVIVPKENETAGEVSMLGGHDEGLASHRSGMGLIKEENEQYLGIEGANTWSTAAGIAKAVSGVAHAGAAIAAAIVPDSVTTIGYRIATSTATVASVVGDGFSFVSQGWRTYAEQQGMLASHIRRRDEWAFQSNQTLKELQQIDRQLLANQIRIDITKKELNNHDEQLEQSKAMDEVLRSKFTNKQLYQWMLDQLSKLYFSTYRMALDMARRAERAASRELGTKPLNILSNDYWDSLRMGLLAGEKLHQDLKRLEISYIDQNRREYELTKHISLRQLDPEALIDLRFKNSSSKNSCEFSIPEWLFDLDTPGHYLRRIKSVSVSIPCIAGPYTSVNCKLTLGKNSIRYDSISTNYLRDDRFTDYYGASEAIVTSNANSDSGLFETALHDERFLPFEHSGVISSWLLELPDNYAQFDYSTISDVILTFRYTARDGGVELKNEAQASIETLLSPPKSSDPKAPLQFPLLLSCRSDFSNQWSRANATTNLLVPITSDLIPYGMGTNMRILNIRFALLIDGQPITFSDADWPVNRNNISYADLGLIPKVTKDVIVLLTLGK
jgi:5-hydroxyisourate hydrolase-like protein (transthyretin family)